jgi:serine/threonine protein kinase
VLLNSKKRFADVKLADFGLSALIRLGEAGYDPEESSKRKQYIGLKDMWGTKEYFAPEVIDMAYVFVVLCYCSSFLLFLFVTSPIHLLPPACIP